MKINLFDQLAESVTLALEEMGSVTEPITDQPLPSAIPAPTEEKLPIKTERWAQLALRLLDVISSLEIPDTMRHQILEVEKIPLSAENLDKIQAGLEQIADSSVGGFPQESE